MSCSLKSSTFGQTISGRKLTIEGKQIEQNKNSLNFKKFPAYVEKMNPKFQKCSSKKNLAQEVKNPKVQRLNSSEFSNAPNTNRKTLNRPIKLIKEKDEFINQNNKKNSVKQKKTTEKVNLRKELISADISGCLSPNRSFKGKIDGRISNNGDFNCVLKGTFRGELILQKDKIDQTQRATEKNQKLKQLPKKDSTGKKKVVENLKLDALIQKFDQTKNEELKNGSLSKQKSKCTTRKLSKRKSPEININKIETGKSFEPGKKDFLKLDLTKIKNSSCQKNELKVKNKTKTDRPNIECVKSGRFKNIQKPNQSFYENISDRNFNLKSQKTDEILRMDLRSDIDLAKKMSKCKIVCNKKQQVIETHIKSQEEPSKKKIKITKSQFRAINNNLNKQIPKCDSKISLNDVWKDSVERPFEVIDKKKTGQLSKRTSDHSILDFCDREFIFYKYRFKTRKNQFFIVKRLVIKIQRVWREYVLKKLSPQSNSSHESVEFNELTNEQNESDNKTIIILNNNMHTEQNDFDDLRQRKIQKLTSTLRNDFHRKNSEPIQTEALKTDNSKIRTNPRCFLLEDNSIGFSQEEKPTNISKKNAFLEENHSYVKIPINDQNSEVFKKKQSHQFEEISEQEASFNKIQKLIKGTSLDQNLFSQINQKHVPELIPASSQISVEEKNQLGKLTSAFDTLSNEHLKKWKDFYEYLESLKNDPQTIKSQNYQKMMANAARTLHFLQANLDIENLNLARLKSENSNSKKQGSGNGSIILKNDVKSKEKWIKINSEVEHKNSYKLLHDRYFQNSNQSVSKSLVFSKNLTDKSFRSDFNGSIKEEANQNDMIASLSDQKHKIAKNKENKEISNQEKSKKSLLIDQLSDYLFEYLVHDLIHSEQISKNTKQTTSDSEPLFKKNVQSLHKYLNNISEFVIFSSLNEIRMSLNKPIHLPEHVILSSFYSENVEINEIDPILKLEYYLSFEEKDVEETVSDELASEVKHIVHKCYFDSLNEALDELRVYGLEGYRNRNICCFSDNSPVTEFYNEIETITAIEKACNLLLNWNDTLCGFYGQETSLNNQIESQYINLLREERMNKLIFHSMQEEDYKWKNKDREKIEVKVQIAEIITDYLLNDMIQFLSQN